MNFFKTWLYENPILNSKLNYTNQIRHQKAKLANYRYLYCVKACSILIFVSVAKQTLANTICPKLKYKYFIMSQRLKSSSLSLMLQATTLNVKNLKRDQFQNQEKSKPFFNGEQRGHKKVKAQTKTCNFSPKNQ